MIEPVETMNRRPLAAVSLADLPRQLRANADEMNGWSVGNEAEHARQAADEIERLRAIIAVLGSNRHHPGGYRIPRLPALSGLDYRI